MQSTKDGLARRPSIARILAFILLCLLFIGSAYLLNRFSGIIFSLYVALVYGVLLFLAQYNSSRGSRGRSFFLVAALYYVLVLWLLSRQQLNYEDRYTGFMMLASSLVAWTGFCLTFYRRWPFPYFRWIFFITIALWGLDFYWAAVHESLPRVELVRSPQLWPRIVTWSSNGDAFYLNQDNESEMTGILHRFDMETCQLKSISFPGIITQANYSPDGLLLAVAHETKDKLHHLILMDTRTYITQEIYAGKRAIYFPFRSTQSPWSPSGRWAMFMDISKSEMDLWTYDRQTDQIQHLGKGQGVGRAYWINDGQVVIPRGNPPQTYTPTLTEWAEIISASGEMIEKNRILSRAYDSFYAYSGYQGLVLKKNPGAFYWTDRHFGNEVQIPIASLSFLQVDFSPDGQWIAYPVNLAGRMGGCQLRIFNRQNGEEKILFQSPMGQMSSITWSPQGHWIAFSLQTFDNWLVHGASIHVVSPETGQRYKVASQSDEIAQYCSRAGRKFLFWRPEHEQLLYWTRVRLSKKENPMASYCIVQCP